MRGTIAYFRICLPPLICARWPFPAACGHSQGVALLHRLSLAAGLFSPFTWLETIGGRYGPLRVLRPAGRDVEKHASLYTCGFLSDRERERDRDRDRDRDRQRQRQRLNAKRPACQSNQLTDASQNSLTVAALLRK